MQYNLGNFSNQLSAPELDEAVRRSQTTNFNSTGNTISAPQQQTSQVDPNGAQQAMTQQQATDDEIPGQPKGKKSGGLKNVLGYVGAIAAFL